MATIAAKSPVEWSTNREMESIQEIKSFLENVDAVMFDCDGVLWLGPRPLKNSNKLVTLLRSMGKRVFFLTNNNQETRLDLLEKFNSLGFETSQDEILAAAYLPSLYLKQQGFQGKAYVVGSDAIAKELSNIGIENLPIGPDPVPANSEVWKEENFEDVEIDPEVGAVIVGLDYDFSYNKALKAATYLNTVSNLGKERIFIGTSTDKSFPGREELYPGVPKIEMLRFPDTGTIVNAIATCSGREPIITGKPEVYPFQLIQKEFGLDPNRVLMIGDRGSTDMLFGRKCGLWTLLVLSGDTNLAQMREWQESTIEEEKLFVPDYFTENLDEFYQLILKI